MTACPCETLKGRAATRRGATASTRRERGDGLGVQLRVGLFKSPAMASPRLIPNPRRLAVTARQRVGVAQKPGRMNRAGLSFRGHSLAPPTAWKSRVGSFASRSILHVGFRRTRARLRVRSRGPTVRRLPQLNHNSSPPVTGTSPVTHRSSTFFIHHRTNRARRRRATRRRSLAPRGAPVRSLQGEEAPSHDSPGQHAR